MRIFVPATAWFCFVFFLSVCGSSDSALGQTDSAKAQVLNQSKGQNPVKNSDRIEAAESDKQPSTPEKRIADLEQQIEKLTASIESAASTGNIAWMMTASALVLFMTAPGLAMFYGGLVRQKNVLSVMMQCLFLMGFMTVLWAVCGYSFAFGGDGAYFGNFDHLFMKGVGMHAEGGDIPELLFMVFQGMFFIITPALICGAFAERMKFSTMVLFSALWGLFVYCPLCHWVWDGGILAFGGDNSWAGGAIDFAGGTVVHISSGVSALLIALLIGQRIGFGSRDLRPHNLTFTSMGAAMLWVGWFGFNAGSAAASTDRAVNAFVVTHFSAAAGAVAWATMEWITRGKPTILGTASGAVAGLVCITPASGCVYPMPAIVMGLLAGITCYFACGALKSKFKYDDSLDAFGVHGVGGALGAVLIGFFACKEVGDEANGIFYNAGEGITLMVGQVVAVLVTIAFSVVATFILLKVLDSTLGLRVHAEDEQRGLDITEHGEEGYIFSR